MKPDNVRMVHFMGKPNNISKFKTLAFFNAVNSNKLDCPLFPAFVHNRMFTSTNFVVQYVVLHRKFTPAEVDFEVSGHITLENS